MARDLSPIGKQSRRESYALSSKGQKVMARKSGIPGMHAGMRTRGGNLYLTQLREKQKVRRIYGLLEKQFANLVNEAERAEGMTGEKLLEFLESRLDNTVYRAGFAPSRRAARQLVSHGHFLLNGRRVDIPSIRVKTGDVITVRQLSRKKTFFANILDLSNANSANLSWLKVNPKDMQVDILGTPKREEAEVGINEQLIVEFYSR